MNHFKQDPASLPAKSPDTASDDSSMDVKTFKPRAFGNDVHKSYERTREQFGNLAGSELKSDSRFNLHPAARKSLGIENEENRHIEGKIADEVERRVEQLRSKAHLEGIESGRVEGARLAQEAFMAQAQPIYQHFIKIVSEFEDAKNDIFLANEQFLIQLIFQVARQVVLKELKTDQDYVKRLCLLLIERIGAKDYVKIKVSRDDFAQVEAIRDYLKQQFSELKNIQIDVSDDLQNGGCKVETDLSRINAGVETQLQLINQALGEP